MAKHSRKRQKTSQATFKSADDKQSRLDLLLDERTKDDEERRLESLLFGVKYVPRENGKGKGKEIVIEGSETDDMEVDDGGRGLTHLLDQDLFFVDEGINERPSSPIPDDGSDYGEEDIEQSNSEGHQTESEPSSSSQTPAPLQTKLSSSKKPPAWVDSTDANDAVKISLLKGPSRLRKLRQAVDEDQISSREYETRLRRHHEAINPEPEWAKKARKFAKKSQWEDADEEGSDDDQNAFLSSTNGILKNSRADRKAGKVLLPHGQISIERLRDANQATQNSGSGEVRVATFHPNATTPILCVATADRRIRLFNVDGHLSPLLTTLHFPNLPMTSPTSALFHPSGQSLLVSGPRPFFYTYDLQSGTPTYHAKGLWGTTFSNLNDGTSIVQRRRKRDGDNGALSSRSNGEAMSLTSFSPSGDVLAVAGRGGYVHLVDWKSGAGQVIGSLKCSASGGGSGAGGIHGLWWIPPNLSGNALGDGISAGSRGSNSRLAVMTGDAEVYIWDVGQRKCLKRWQDEGGFRSAAQVMAGTTNSSGYLAVGSSTGYVNVYGSDSYSVSEETFTKPKPLRSIANLTTPISALKFNHDAQLLAIASKDKKDSMRLIHLPSLTAFSNWPTSSTPLGHVTAMDFSTRSEFLAIGNTRGRVLLYHLKDYGVW